MKNISIIIVTYNNQNQIIKCLDSIENSAKSNRRVNLIIIDNASIDATIDTVRKNISSSVFDLIENKKNLGFAAAINQGLKYAQKKFNSDYFLLLNPDAYLEKNCLKKMIERSEKNKEIGLVSPLIINPQNNQPWFSGARINWLKMQTYHSPFSKNHKSKNENYLSGCCLLIPNFTFQKIGFFDERFFLYYEDADYSLRAQKAGFKIVLENKATCYHIESQSSNPEIKNYYLVKSGLLFFHKHFSGLILLYFWIIFSLRFFYHKVFSNKKEVFRAIKDFLREYKKTTL